MCPYPGAEPDVWARVIPGDGFVMTLLRDQTLCVLDQSLDGTCRVAFATDLYLPDDFPSFLYETARTAWDGRRLAILIPDIFGQCGFTLAVYTEEGIGYYGTYASSLAGGQPPVELREHLVTVRWTA